MSKSLKIAATYHGKTLDVLDDLIKKRAKALKQTVKQSVIATTINVLASLKSDTKIAPKRGNKKMYTIEKTSYESSWLRSNGKIRRVVRICGHVNETISRMCQNCAGQKSSKNESVSVYKMQLFNENLNRTVYYCHATSERQARDYIEKVILARLLAKERGMAKYALGIAQAYVSDRPLAVEKPVGSKAMQTAYNAARVTTESSDERFSISVLDQLRYSALSLKNGKASITIAMKKAANKTAGLIHLAFANKRFDQDVATPFPEVKTK